MGKLNKILFLFLIIFCVDAQGNAICGCKEMRACYAEMISKLAIMDEEFCIEDTTMGTSTITIFLRAIAQFCAPFVKIAIGGLTDEKRYLFEVTLEIPTNEEDPEKKSKPVIIIEAGQLGGSESMGFALYVIEQLLGCYENNHMLAKVKWVILPSTNPDGQEFDRFTPEGWTKNTKQLEKQARGVDISRNFENNWDLCPKAESVFSDMYPGPSAASEVETQFIKRVIAKYLQDTKLYLSIRRDGHHILYPYAHTNSDAPNMEFPLRVAGEVANRVNLRTSTMTVFNNMSIFAFEGRAHCGHSVDYAYDQGIPLAFEMRVFLGTHYEMTSQFQPVPMNYESTLRNGYLSAIKELYNAVTNERKYGKVP